MVAKKFITAGTLALSLGVPVSLGHAAPIGEPLMSTEIMRSDVPLAAATEAPSSVATDATFASLPVSSSFDPLAALLEAYVGLECGPGASTGGAVALLQERTSQPASCAARATEELFTSMMDEPSDGDSTKLKFISTCKLSIPNSIQIAKILPKSDGIAEAKDQLKKVIELTTDTNQKIADAATDLLKTLKGNGDVKDLMVKIRDEKKLEKTQQANLEAVLK